MSWVEEAFEAVNLGEFILDSAVQDVKAMQDFDVESLMMGADHSQMVKAAPIISDYASKDGVDLASSTAESRIILIAILGGYRMRAEARLMREQEEEVKRLDVSKRVECFFQSKLELLSREYGASMGLHASAIFTANYTQTS